MMLAATWTMSALLLASAAAAVYWIDTDTHVWDWFALTVVIIALYELWYRAQRGRTAFGRRAPWRAEFFCDGRRAARRDGRYGESPASLRDEALALGADSYSLYMVGPRKTYEFKLSASKPIYICTERTKNAEASA